MKKENASAVKKYIDEVTGMGYIKTFSSKSETLHIRVASYTDGECNEPGFAKWYKDRISERESLISKISERFPQYEVSENNKRYQGFINDICITIH